MKAQYFIFLVVGVALLVLVILQIMHYQRNFTKSTESNKSILNVHHLVRIIDQQNNTLSELMDIVRSDSNDNKITDLFDKLHRKDLEIEALSSNLENSYKKINELEKIVSVSHVTSKKEDVNKNFLDKSLHFKLPVGKLDENCENRYGLNLINEWRRSKKEYCGTSTGKHKSELICYPYTQEHKKSESTKDIFCEAKNFFIDFSKISGEASKNKPSLGHQYLNFQKGSIFSTCTKTSWYDGHFMNHHRAQMSTFVSDSNEPDEYDTVDVPTYLLARDEDCENTFHSTADFMNMFLVMNIIGVDPLYHQVMLFDQHPDGPYMELIKSAFSPNYEVLRNSDYRNKKVLFRHLIFHLESPAGLIFPKVSRPDPLRCYSTSLFQEYRKFILQSFNLYDIAPPEIPTITLTLRHRTPSKNVGRILDNEDEVINLLHKGNMINVNVVDTAKMTFREQLTIIRSTNILVGVHGAGLMLIMFAADEAILIEIHPSYRQDRHFRHASRMTGKIYMPIRTLTRESCVGSSDNVHVPIDEFRNTIDGAVRIARSFDDGISECGLQCPGSILALDNRLNSHYKNGERKENPINTKFPCS
jgi:hypothetical protein